MSSRCISRFSCFLYGTESFVNGHAARLPSPYASAPALCKSLSRRRFSRARCNAIFSSSSASFISSSLRSSSSCNPRNDFSRSDAPMNTRLVFHDHAGVGGNAHFAVRKGVQRVDGDVRRNTGRQLHFDLHVLGGIVHHFFDLDLAVVVRLSRWTPSARWWLRHKGRL